jgi:hypothetical protein
MPSFVVTGVFRHWRGEVYELDVESEPAAIVVTQEHPFWSVDRNAWTAACALRAGERLQAQDGRTPRVLSFKPRDGVQPVYNIEVEGRSQRQKNDLTPSNADYFAVII